MTKRQQNKIIKYILDRPRYNGNKTDFVAKCYDDFNNIDNTEIKNFLMDLATKGYIECSFAGRGEKAWCNITLNEPILEYFSNRRQRVLLVMKDHFRFSITTLISAISIIIAFVSLVLSIISLCR